MAERKEVWPQRGVPAPSPSRGDPRDTALTPIEVLGQHVRRLALLAFMGGAVWTAGLFVDLFLIPSVIHGGRNTRAILIEAVGGIVTLAFGVLAVTSRTATQRKADAALGLTVFNAALLAAYATWALPPPDAGRRMFLSWFTVIILTHSIVAPPAPRKMLAAALVGASMDPLAIWLATKRAMELTSLAETWLLVWPNYACALIAVLSSRAFQHMRIRPSEQHGSYRLVEHLGSGGMGEVWRAQHRLLAREAAIKLIRPALLGARNEAEAQLLRRRFEREAQATASLRSPHTIQVFDFGVTEDGSFYYVMELLAGRDLESLVRNFGPLPADRVGFLLRQVCHSLADAHARGFVHRDVKPANIYVCRMGLEYDFVKVLDFGLVKVTGRSHTMERLATPHSRASGTFAPAVSGTPAYMAPEMILGDTEVDKRVDVYALGCVAYFLLTGCLVFEADTPLKLFMQCLQEEPVPPSQRSGLPVPGQMDEFVMACLQKNPERRPQSGRDLFQMISACCSGAGWSNESAEAWWRAHLPELTGELASTLAARGVTHATSA